MKTIHGLAAAYGKPAPHGKRRIGIIGYPGVQALDLVGPADAFAIADEYLRAEQRVGGYEVVVLGLSKTAFAAESGVLLKPHTTLEASPPLDTLVISGGRGLRVPESNRKVVAWLAKRAAGIRRIASVCTGIYALAATGLLDGKRVTTHWRFARDVAQHFPRVQVEPNALFLKSGKFYTAAGITAGIDLSLALIEEDHGPGLALSVARELVVYLKRPGGQEQYSEPLRFQIKATDRLAELVPWIAEHLQENLSVEKLAHKACLSPRQFTRRFKGTFSTNPGEFVESLRLDEARNRLVATNCSVEAVANSVGFASADSFRRAFERRFGIAPTVYRGRFAAS
jgi:transcriptional regulator GlxA family with amidase domain